MGNEFKRITLEVPYQLYEKIRMLAIVEDETISTITRRALSSFCDTNSAHKIRLLDERGKR
jgi:hypothetical protein